MTRSTRFLAPLGGLVATVTLATGVLAGQAADPPKPSDPPARTDPPPKTDPPGKSAGGPPAGGGSGGADAPPEADPPAGDDPAGATPPPASDPPKSLDELLGIGGESEDDAPSGEPPADAPPAAGDLELDAALGERSLDDLLQLAIEGMEVAAGRLEQRRTDLETQRTQEDVMRRLEQLIDAARRQQQQQQQQSSSSSSSQQQQDVGRQESRSREQQQQGAEQQQQQQPAGGAEPGEGLPPGFQDGPLDSEIAEEGEEWGALPERVRDMLLQGRRERFSSLYERLTRAYYRRLAEEGSQ